MWFRLLQQLWRAVLFKLQLVFGSTSGTTLAFTGILGLAAVVYLLKYLRGGQKPAQEDSQQQQQYDSSSPAAAGAAASGAAGGSTAPSAAASLSAAVARRLAGMQSITMSVPGVLIEEMTPPQLDESATVVPGAIEVAREIARHCRRGLYLMCQVDDDIGEAVVRGTLEHAGLLGNAPGQVPPHRLLFCETLEGKQSFVRQLEPDLHIDAHPHTIGGLQRFIKRLALVAAEQHDLPGSSGGGVPPNVQQAPSLAALLGVPAT